MLEKQMELFGYQKFTTPCIHVDTQLWSTLLTLTISGFARVLFIVLLNT